MQVNHFHKPENVLRRARDLVAVGKKNIALKLLHEMLCSRRHRTWQKTHEEVMCVYLQLCVDLKNNRMAKEGLHQYRNISQQQAPGSLEVVIEFMLKLADQRARKAAQHCTNSVFDDVEDLENDTTPESILLATVTSEKGKERTEREHLVPWLKFLWETYRTVLEILRNNPKMEQVYHNTAHKAFGFCAEYQRNTEFRRLCDILRNHLTNQQKYGKDPQGNLAAETMELHLATRFEQLKVSSTLRLWHEGFRTIEDIHLIMSISNKRPSSQLMATYYQKLTDLFLISENFLFHAYAYKAFYIISREKNKSLTTEQSQVMASCVLLAAMSIPMQSSKAGTTFVEEGLEKEKNRRMAQLLGFDINPKRKSLLQDLLNQKILQAVLPEVADLYYCLERKFVPLELVAQTVPLLSALKGNEKLNVYIKPLEKLLVVRLVAQLSKVYYSVRLDHFKELLAGLETPFLEIEKTVAKAVKTRQVNVVGVRIDHQAGCIRFGEDVMEEKRTRKLLQDMATGLAAINKDIIPVDEMKNAVYRAELTQTVLATVTNRHRAILNRKVEIEKRKEDFEKGQAQLAKQRARERQAEELRVRALEAKKMNEHKEAIAKAKAKTASVQATNLDYKTDLMKKGFAAEEVDNLDAKELQDLIKQTKEKAEKDLQETQRKIQAASRRLDSMVRATRELEAPRRRELYEKFVQDERERYEQSIQKFNEEAVVEHQHAVKRRDELAPMQSFRDSFEQPWFQKWKEQFVADCEQRAKDRTIQRFQQKITRARRRRMDEIEAARIRAEKEEQEQLEAARREQREVEAARLAEENRIRDARAKAMEAESGQGSSSSASAQAPTDGKWRPRSREGQGELPPSEERDSRPAGGWLRQAQGAPAPAAAPSAPRFGSGGGWRERERARQGGAGDEREGSSPFGQSRRSGGAAFGAPGSSDSDSRWRRGGK